MKKDPFFQNRLLYNNLDLELAARKRIKKMAEKPDFVEFMPVVKSMPKKNTRMLRAQKLRRKIKFNEFLVGAVDNVEIF